MAKQLDSPFPTPAKDITGLKSHCTCFCRLQFLKERYYGKDSSIVTSLRFAKKILKEI